MILFTPISVANGLAPHAHGNLNYFLSSDSPRVLIGSGLHGDEYEVIPLLIETLIRLKDQLPPFICIPALSPSAVARRTRINQEGIDLNRNFNNPLLVSPEIEAIKKIVGRYQPYETVLTVHQDLARAEAYLYDGCLTPHDEKVKAWQLAVRQQGVQLLNECDDLDDPCLGMNFRDGYYNFDPTTDTFIETFETWSSLHAGAKRNITLEVPTLISDDQKRWVIEQSLLTLL
ncbi:MAG TPA: hypothetical protein VF209_05270 [Patescibacteria group bacterium]